MNLGIGVPHWMV